MQRTDGIPGQAQEREANVVFPPEFCEAIADGLNLIGIEGAFHPTQITLTIDLKPYILEITPELILTLQPLHAEYHSLLLSEEATINLLVIAQERSVIIPFHYAELCTLFEVADKIIAGARGELLPNLRGEIPIYLLPE